MSQKAMRDAIAKGFGSMGVSSVQIGNRKIKCKKPPVVQELDGIKIGDHVNVWMHSPEPICPGTDGWLGKTPYKEQSNAVVTAFSLDESMLGKPQRHVNLELANRDWSVHYMNTLLEHGSWHRRLEKLKGPVAPYVSPLVASYVYEVLVRYGAACVKNWPSFLRAMSCHKWGCAEWNLDPNYVPGLFPNPFHKFPRFYNPDWRIDCSWDNTTRAQKAVAKINAELRILKERWQDKPWNPHGMSPPCFMDEPAKFVF